MFVFCSRQFGGQHRPHRWQTADISCNSVAVVASLGFLAHCGSKGARTVSVPSSPACCNALSWDNIAASLDLLWGKGTTTTTTTPAYSHWKETINSNKNTTAYNTANITTSHQTTKYDRCFQGLQNANNWLGQIRTQHSDIEPWRSRDDPVDNTDVTYKAWISVVRFMVWGWRFCSWLIAGDGVDYNGSCGSVILNRKKRIITYWPTGWHYQYNEGYSWHLRQTTTHLCFVSCTCLNSGPHRTDGVTISRELTMTISHKDVTLIIEVLQSEFHTLCRPMGKAPAIATPSERKHCCVCIFVLW